MPLFLPGSSTTSEEICAKLRGDPLEPAWDRQLQGSLNSTGMISILIPNLFIVCLIGCLPKKRIKIYPTKKNLLRVAKPKWIEIAFM